MFNLNPMVYIAKFPALAIVIVSSSLNVLPHLAFLLSATSVCFAFPKYLHLYFTFSFAVAEQ